VNGTLWTTGVIIALEFVLTSQIYPFMLSSAFTARTIVKEKGDQVDVRRDMWWALALSLAAFILLYGFTQDFVAMIAGSIFSVALFLIYEYRGELTMTGGTPGGLSAGS
jgi:hypothetical protein